jgi:Cu(I)/Ag(I) efflux system membrane fusion protein/cobalt-zinc-cadmium efflux system membrane fusion protein
LVYAFIASNSTHLNPKSRTQTVRATIDNSDLSIVPGSFVNISISLEEEDEAISIPTEAIIHSGDKKIIFISRDDGHFEPREIVTGIFDRQKYKTEVLSGVSEHESVVLSGQFLLDSESQLQEAVAKLLDTRLKSNKPNIKPLLDKPVGVHSRYANMEYVNNTYNWYPKISLREGMKRVYDAACKKI